MKKIISVLLSVMLLLSAFSFTAFAAKDKTEAEETTEFVLEIDVNKRYTDIVEASDGTLEVTEEDKELTDNQKTVYIAILVSALVISVVILAVSVKRVPKEEDIDISGMNNKKKKAKEE